MSYRIVIYTKRKDILTFTSYIIAEKRVKLGSHIASLKMHRTHAHRKFQQNGFTPAHRNLLPHIATSCLAILKFHKEYKNIPCKQFHLLKQFVYSQISLRNNVLRHNFYLPKVIVIQFQSGIGALNRQVPCIKCMELAW